MASGAYTHTHIRTYIYTYMMHEETRHVAAWLNKYTGTYLADNSDNLFEWQGGCYQSNWLRLDISPCSYQCTWPQLDISPFSYQCTRPQLFLVLPIHLAAD